MASKYLIGILVLVVLTASIYILLPESVRIDVGRTYSTFKVWEDGSWVLAGQEYTLMFDGTKKMRASSRTVEHFVEGEIVKIVRTANFKNNVTVIDTYTFDGDQEDIKLFPISHDINVLNGEGYILVYEVTKLGYSGETVKDISSPQEFGHNMRIEWEGGNYYSRIWDYANKDEGKLTVKYRPDSANFTKQVRLFDPPAEVPMIYYRFEDDLTDEGDASLEYTLTPVNSPTYVTGKVDKGMDFERDSSQYAAKTDCDGNEITKIRTIDFWIKPETIVEYTSCFDIEGALHHYFKPFFTGTKLHIKFYDNAAIWEVVSTTDFSAGNWYHIILVMGSGGVKLYINGDTTPEDTDASTTVMPNTYDKIYIGTEGEDFIYEFDGIVDNFAMFDEEYTTDDVTYSWNDGNGRDFSAVVDTCTCSGAGNNWEVDMEDECQFTDDCTLTTGNLSWIGSSGYFNCSAQLNLTNRDAPPSGTIFYHSSGCEVNRI